MMASFPDPDNAMTDQISLDSVVVPVEDQVSARLGEETVILNVESGQYYGLNEVGARVWELIQEPRSLAEVRAALVEEYDVEPQSCERDLRQIVGDLMANGLVAVNEPAG
jgi:hypothetical protein